MAIWETTRGTNPIGIFGHIGHDYDPSRASPHNRLQEGLSSGDRTSSHDNRRVVTCSSLDREKQLASAIV